mmetsp:Transcript_47370/g.119957  ORF Transcript_47370/g.119957 Transcript_47370/m.119957 type:complete len:211 (-) Transcript_47370:56-688(-)
MHHDLNIEAAERHLPTAFLGDGFPRDLRDAVGAEVCHGSARALPRDAEALRQPLEIEATADIAGVAALAVHGTSDGDAGGRSRGGGEGAPRCEGAGPAGGIRDVGSECLFRLHPRQVPDQRYQLRSRLFQHHRIQFLRGVQLLEGARVQLLQGCPEEDSRLAEALQADDLEVLPKLVLYEPVDVPTAAAGGGEEKLLEQLRRLLLTFVHR